MQQSEPIAEHRQMEDLLISKEEIDELVRRWPQLDAKSKYLLEGKYILGKSDEVMAEELSIKPASVRMALTRARQCAYQLLTERANPESFMMNGSGFVAFDRLLCLIVWGMNCLCAQNGLHCLPAQKNRFFLVLSDESSKRTCRKFFLRHILIENTRKSRTQNPPNALKTRKFSTTFPTKCDIIHILLWM